MEKLLIVDDEKMICQEFCATLADLGYDVDYALNGDEALRKIDQTAYRMIFLDLSLPRMNGAEVFKRIRKVNQVPVAFMSGFMSAATEKEVLSMGALRCLRKPVHLSEIIELLDKLDGFNSQSN